MQTELFFSFRSLAIAGMLVSMWGLPVKTWAHELDPLKPMGEAKGLKPGRVAWVHDPEATNWKGPGDGHWWDPSHTRQDRVWLCPKSGTHFLADSCAQRNRLTGGE